MIYSMTGFACIERNINEGTLTLEIRSVNQRYLETFFRLPDSLRSIEAPLRDVCRNQLSRGKVECQLRFKGKQERIAHFNVEQAEQLMTLCSQVEQLSRQKGFTHQPVDTLKVLQWPGVLEQADLDWQAVQTEAIRLFEEGIQALKAHRANEGQQLMQMLSERLTSVAELAKQVQQQMPAVIQWQRERLTQRLQDVGQQVLDQNRLEQEIALLAQRIDVAEEIDRLQAHVEATQAILVKGGICGRRLDFMMQELNREANTLGSKSINVEITNITVELKVLIEQMREQIQNLE